MTDFTPTIFTGKSFFAAAAQLPELKKTFFEIIQEYFPEDARFFFVQWNKKEERFNPETRYVETAIIAASWYTKYGGTKVSLSTENFSDGEVRKEFSFVRTHEKEKTWIFYQEQNKWEKFESPFKKGGVEGIFEIYFNSSIKS